MATAIPYQWQPAQTAQYDPSAWSLFSQTPWAGTSANPNAGGEWSPTGEWVPEGYQAGFHKQDNTAYWALRDPSGNIINTWQGAARDSLGSSDYALMATMATLGYGAAGGFGALGGAGAGAAGETAALGAGQVGALGTGEVAGLGGAAGGGFAAPGGAASLYAPTGYAAGGGSALAGTGLAGSAMAPAAAGLNWGAIGKAGIGMLGGLASAGAQGSAAQQASGIQQQAAQAGQAQLAPYATAGTGALSAQQDLLGLNGPEAQAKAIAALQASPQFTAQQQLGENRILANASATGGLRGGNVQAALAQYSPALLSQIIGEQYSRLGGLTNTGLSAAGGVSNLIQQGGAAQAGGALAKGQTNANYIGSAVNALGLYYGLNGGW